MDTNRRVWVKQVGLSIFSLYVSQLRVFASPVMKSFALPADDGPTLLIYNENPYGPSPLARIAMSENINNTNRYNWDLIGNLISAIAKKNGLGDNQIILGEGSTPVIDKVVQLVAAQKGNFIMGDPSFGNWTGRAEFLGMKKIAIPLTSDKKLDLHAMLSAINTDTRMVYICNPNNPSGTICDHDALVSFIREATKKTTVLVDEAYIDYSGQSSVSNMVTDNENLIVSRTFSKIYGMAGGRVGYVMAHANVIQKLEKLQTWANGGIGIVSRAAAIASLKDDKFVKECFELNAKARAYAIEEMEKLNIRCIPSHTNFIYFSLEKYKKDYTAQLEKNKILGPGIYEENGKWCRITVGTMEEMKKFISAIG